MSFDGTPYWPLWLHMKEAHGLYLTNPQMDAIIAAVEKVADENLVMQVKAAAAGDAEAEAGTERLLEVMTRDAPALAPSFGKINSQSDEGVLAMTRQAEPLPEIVVIIGKYLELEHQPAQKSWIPFFSAGETWLANCPFCKKRSFNISPRHQIWHCFMCHKGGDVNSFIREYEKDTTDG